MSKYLKKVIEEMGSYADMGMPTGQGSMGIGSAAPVGNGALRGGSDGKPILKAYKLNDVLRSRNRAEEEEGMEDMDMDMDMDTDDGMDDNSELKAFFTDNPAPSDEEIAAYAEERGMDLEEMRQAVYSLIQELLGSDEEDMGDEEDSIDFEVSGDTGERPASNEMSHRGRM